MRLDGQGNAMRRWRRGLFVMALVTASISTACGSSVTASSEPAVAPQREQARQVDRAVAEQLDAAIDGAMKAAAIPGASVGIWGPDGDYVKAFGVANKTTGAPMTTDLHHRIGSVTKTFTVTGILQLVDAGKLSLDDPIGKFVDGVPRGDKITIRNLARMQSGLFNYSDSEEFGQALYGDPRRRYRPQQLLDLAFENSNASPPGQGFTYCNTNTILLGLVVEKLSGQSLPDYLRDHVTAPLGMKDTSFAVDGNYPESHAQGYGKGPDGGLVNTTDWNPSWAWAAGAMISTLEDMHVWAPAVATGQLLSAAMQAQRLQTVPAPPGAPNGGYGLGLFDLAGWIGHNGSVPGYQTAVFYLPEKQTTMVVFTNTDIGYQGLDTSAVLATAVTSVISPDHLYRLEPH
jgi:D-alanyl-D-alanine carboxypeptidase